MAKITTKVGDVFSVQIDAGTQKYFQYVANDLTQLNSDVIRVFKQGYSIAKSYQLSDVIKDEVDFYAHCVIKWGIKTKLWEKVGYFKDVGDLQMIFRCSNDYGHKLGNDPIKVSHNWRVWKINEEFREVGKLVGENQRSEIGIVVSPLDVVHRMRTGEYNFVYPGY